MSKPIYFAVNRLYQGKNMSVSRKAVVTARALWARSFSPINAGARTNSERAFVFLSSADAISPLWLLSLCF